MFVTKAVKVKKIRAHPGNVIVFGQEKDVYIVNVYKMMVLKHFICTELDSASALGCVFKDKHLVIFDQYGKVQIWNDESEPSPVKNPQNSIMLEMTNQDEYEQFQYQLAETLGQANGRVLAYRYVTPDNIMLVHSHGIDWYRDKSRREVVRGLEEELVFGKFVGSGEGEMVIGVDRSMNVRVWDAEKLRREQGSG